MSSAHGAAVVARREAAKEMTKEEILMLPAGPELDRLIAEKIFAEHLTASPFSTDIAAAWRIVDKLRCVNDHVSVDVEMESSDGDVWVNVNTGVARHEYRGPYWQALAETVPLALCRVALLALETEAL